MIFKNFTYGKTSHKKTANPTGILKSHLTWYVSGLVLKRFTLFEC